MIAPEWMHSQITAAEYESWSAEQCAGIEIVDGMVIVSPSAVVYRADTIDITPTRPEHVLLVAEIVSPGSETTDRIVKLDQYACAGIPFYWRLELTATGIPVVYTYLLDSASRRYRDGEAFTGLVKASVPFQIEIDLSSAW
jgi:Uma2 family endonuclease